MRSSCFFLLFFVILFSKAQSQFITFSSANNGWENIANNVQVKFEGEIPHLLSTNLIKESNFQKEHTLHFSLINDQIIYDSVFLYLGQWLDFEFFRIVNKDTIALPIEKFAAKTLIDKLPTGKILLAPGDTAQILIKPKTTFFNFEYFKPAIVKRTAISSFVYAQYYEVHKPYVIITILFIGLMIAICIYAGFSFLLQRTADYFYYGVYAFFFLAFFAVRIYFLAKTDYNILRHSFFVIQSIQVIGYVFYGYFIIEFFGLRKKKDVLYLVLKVLAYLAVIFTISDYVLLYQLSAVKASMKLYTLFRFLLIGIAAFTFFNLMKREGDLTRFIAWGVFMLCFFGVVSLIISKTSTSFNNPYYNPFFDLRISLYQLGISLELILFTVALQYKFIKRSNDSVKEFEALKLQSEKSEFENRMKILEVRDKERTRIAQEIHDDIGSGLTNIRLVSEIAISKHQKEANLNTELGKISNVANELVENMNEIVWAINTKNDNLKNTFAYLRSYVANYFEDYDTLDVKLDVEQIEHDVVISGELRRAAFLLVKESLHNIIKHSGASQVHFQLILLKKNLINIVVRDNGCGIKDIDPNSLRNGIKNMLERVVLFNGNIRYINNRGTIVLIQLPITR